MFRRLTDTRADDAPVEQVDDAELDELEDELKNDTLGR